MASSTNSQPLPMLSPHYVSIIIFPILIFLTGEVLVALFAAYPTTLGGLISDASETKPSDAMEAGLRVRMLGQFLLLLVVAIMITIKFEIERRTRFEAETGRWMLIGTAICIGVGVAIILSSFSGRIPRSFDVIGQDVFEKAFELSANMPNAMTGYTFRFMMNFGGLLVGVAVAYLIMGAISSLTVLKDAPPDVQKSHWKLQADRLQVTTYISTALLVVGLLYIQSWAQWPTFAFAPPTDKAPNPSAAAYGTIVNSYLAYTGIQYSLLLASFIIPVAMFMNAEADRIAIRSLTAGGQQSSANDGRGNAAFPTVAISAQRKADNLVIPFVDQLKAIAAILAPFIAGSLGNIAALLTGKT